MSGRHALQDPVGAFYGTVYLAGSAVLLILLVLDFREPCPCTATAALHRPVGVSVPDAPPPDT
jgi:hypothetical protein